MNSAVKEFFEAKSMQIGEAMQNEYRKIEKNSYTIEYNEATGEIAGIYDRLNPGANWKAEADDKNWGPFLFTGLRAGRMKSLLQRLRIWKKGSKGFQLPAPAGYSMNLRKTEYILQ